uniref:RING-type domain-containing protein n=1 Tax=Fagus sylvatica TaxID=28930 RepID=A0A2N9EDL5_FAGSY
MEGGGRRRLTLWDQMSAVESSVSRDSLAGLTLNDVLSTTEKRAATSPSAPVPQLSNRTLLDVIHEQDPNARSAFKGLHHHHNNNNNNNNNNNRDKKSWKSFKDKLRLKRAGAAWISSVPIPASDIPLSSQLSLSLSRRNSLHFHNSSDSTRIGADSPDPQPAPTSRPQFSRHNSTRFAYTNLRQNSMYNRNTDETEDEEEGENRTEEDDNSPHAPRRRLSVALAEERSLSAREAVAAQEAAEAERQEQLIAAAETAEPQVRMSLMDLMDYNLADDEEEEEEDEDDNEEEAKEENDGEQGGREYNCCVCMVRHKGSAFIPCGHTFCRLCSRELMVSRGNCPLCNRFILEILDIF